MFRPARMQKLSIVTLNQYIKPVVDVLYERGLVEIEDLSEQIGEDEEYTGLDVSKQDPYATKIASLSMKCDNIIDTLKSAEQKTGMVDVIKGFLSPKEIKPEEVENLSPEDLVQQAESIINKVDSVLSPIESHMNAIGTEENKYKDQLKVATQLSSFDIDFAYLQDTEYVKFTTGLLPNEHLSEAKEAIDEVTDEVIIFEGSSNSDGDTAVTPLVVVSSAGFEEEISSILRRSEFEKLDITGLSGKSSEIIEAATRKLDELKNEKEQCVKDIREVGLRSKDQLLVLNEQLAIEKERTEIYSCFGETQTTKMFKVWVMKKDVDETLTVIDQVTEGNSIIEVEDPTQEEIDENKVPVKQDNPGFAKPYELLVNMYSTPNYNDLDPTIIMALFLNLNILSKAVTKKEGMGILPIYFPKKMPSSLSYLAINQLKKIEQYNNHRRGIAQYYNHLFLKGDIDDSNIYLKYPLLVDNPFEVINKLRKYNIYINDGWSGSPIVPLSTELDKVCYNAGSCPKAEEISKKIILLPTHINISKQDAKWVFDCLENIRQNR